MKRNLFFLATILGFVLCASCTKEIENNGGSTSNNGISIDEVSILDAQTKAGAISSQTYKVEGDDYSFIITETTEPIVGEAETKALADKTGIMDATTLQTTGFTVDGYLGNEINSTTHPQDLHFIDKEPASYSNGKWHFDNTQYWKDQINHYFWAYAPATNVSNFSVTPSTGVATFSYTSDFNHDLILSKTEKYWSYAETCANGEHSGDGVDFNFTHALAGLKINYDFETWAVTDKDDKTKKAKEAGRITISSVDIHDISTTGNCTFGSDRTYNWTVPSTSTTAAKTHSITATADASTAHIFGTSNGPEFVIPQAVPEKVLCLNIYDTKKKLTYPKFIELPGKTNNSWDANVMHTYNITGTITASYQPSDIEGLKFEFDGHKFFNSMVLAGLEGKYMKTIEISWDGIPTRSTGGSASQCYILIAPDDQNSITMDDKGDVPSKYNDLSKGGYPHVVFAASIAGSHGVESTLRGDIEVATELSQSHCTTGPIELTSDMVDANGNFKLWAGYFGSDSSGLPIWIANNLSIRVLEYY